MIYLNPKGSLNGQSLSGNGINEYQVTYSFAQKLMDALKAKGEGVWASRTSPYAVFTDAELDKKMALDRPSLIINIACYSDVDPAVRGFNIDCNKYSAFVGTTVLAFKNCGFSPLFESGWSVNNKSTSAALQELTIYLGYVSNVADAAILTEANLTRVVTQIVQLAYAPPVILGQSGTDLLNHDPYLSTDDYAIDAVASGVPIKAAKGVITDTVLIANKSLEHLWLVSAKGSGSVTVVDGAGVETIVPLADTKDWELLSGPYTGTGSIRIVGGADTLFTALWVASKGSLGALDDPLKKYSILPPQYVEAFQFDPNKITGDLGGNVLTTATDLLGRAADFQLPDMKSALAALYQKIDMAQINPQSFINNIDEFCSQLKAIDFTKIPVIDPNTIEIKYDKIEELLQHVNRIDKRAAIIEATNMMRNVERAVRQQLDSVDAEKLIQETKQNADPIVKRMEEIGRRLSQK